MPECTEKSPFKVIVHLKMNILLLFTHPHALPNPEGLSVFSGTQKEKFSGMFMLLLSLQ